MYVFMYVCIRVCSKPYLIIIHESILIQDFLKNYDQMKFIYSPSGGAYIFSLVLQWFDPFRPRVHQQ